MFKFIGLSTNIIFNITLKQVKVFDKTGIKELGKFLVDNTTIHAVTLCRPDNDADEDLDCQNMFKLCKYLSKREIILRKLTFIVEEAIDMMEEDLEPLFYSLFTCTWAENLEFNVTKLSIHPIHF